MAAQRETMKSSIRSFHVLSAAELKQLQPLTLKLVTAKSGDTYGKLAQRSPLARIRKGTCACSMRNIRRASRQPDKRSRSLNKMYAYYTQLKEPEITPLRQG